MEEMNPNDCLFASNQYAFSFTQIVIVAICVPVRPRQLMVEADLTLPSPRGRSFR